MSNYQRERGRMLTNSLENAAGGGPSSGAASTASGRRRRVDEIVNRSRVQSCQGWIWRSYFFSPSDLAKLMSQRLDSTWKHLRVTANRLAAFQHPRPAFELCLFWPPPTYRSTLQSTPGGPLCFTGPGRPPR
jgi:hypothetical protein